MSEEKKVSSLNLEDLGYEQELKRSLNFAGVIFFGFAVMCPIAPAAIYGFVAQESYGLVPLVYLVGIIGMIFTALAYAHMGRRFPVAGSVYNYVQRGLNPHVGFIAGWLIMADYFLIPSSCTSLTANWASDLLPGVPMWVFVIVSILIFTFVNIRGINDVTKLNLVICGVMFVCFFVFVICAVKYIANGGGIGFSTAPFYKPDVIDFTFIGSAASLACFSFIGFDSMSTLGEEAKNPARDVPRATVLCLLIMAIMFISMTWLASCAFPNYESLDPDMGFFDICGVVGGTPLRMAFIFALLGANIICAVSVEASVSRIMYSFSRDGLFPKFFGKIHPKYKTPYVATLFCSITTAVFVLFVDTTNLLTLVNFGALSAYILMNFTVFWYFFIKLKRRGVHGIINYLIVPFIGLTVLLYIWIGFDRITLTIGLIWLACGIIWGAVKSKGYKVIPEAYKNTEL